VVVQLVGVSDDGGVGRAPFQKLGVGADSSRDQGLNSIPPASHGHEGPVQLLWNGRGTFGAADGLDCRISGLQNFSENAERGDAGVGKDASVVAGNSGCRKVQEHSRNCDGGPCRGGEIVV
jgi:hypothetical protein